MPVLAIYRSDSVTPAQYEAFRAALPLDAAPAGALIHAYAKPTDGGHCVVEIWESADALEAFNASHVNPLLQKAGVTVIEPELIELETLAVTPEISDYRVEMRRTAAAS